MDRKVRVEEMREPDPERLRRQTEELTVGVEAPRPPGLFDLKRRLIRPIQQLVVDAAVVAIGERQRLGAMPFGLNDRDRPIWEDAPNTYSWRQVLKPGHDWTIDAFHGKPCLTTETEDS